MEKKKGLKILIVGLDGATFDVIDPLFQRGQLPHLRRLVEEGTWGKLRSTIPPRSAPAWSAFMTGKNPGKLGIYDFYTYDPARYSFLKPRLVTSAPLVGQTFWDILGKLGYRVGIITVPVTYPPWEVNGFMVSGYPCPDTEKCFTFPPELADSFTEPYRVRKDVKRTASPEQMATERYQETLNRTSLALRMLREESLNLLCMVLGTTDMAQHFFWKYSAPNSPERDPDDGKFSDMIPKIYRQADECLGRLLQESEEDTLIFVVSDHGGGPAPTKEVNTNYWLRNLGLLRLNPRKHLSSSVQRTVVQFLKRNIRRKAKLRELMPPILRDKVRMVSHNVTSVDWSATKVYRFPMAPPAEGLMINVLGRQAQGVVRQGDEYEQLREYLIDQIAELHDEKTGQLIVEKVYRREELYSGEHMTKAPDLVILFKNDYLGEGGLEPPLITPHPVGKINGYHTLDGIFLARGKGLKGNHHLQGAHIFDLAPTILYALDVPIPKDMDGKVLQDIFEDSFLRRQPIKYTEPLGPSIEPEKALTSEEEEIMKEKLRSLGYLS
jgi:predicted AlkP superfamily phosphohydrolase/phosphomutase